jgi:ribosomal protein S20
MATLLIEAAKEQIDNKEYRAASQTLNRAAQSRPNADEKQQIDALLRQIPRDMK